MREKYDLLAASGLLVASCLQVPLSLCISNLSGGTPTACRVGLGSVARHRARQFVGASACPWQWREAFNSGQPSRYEEARPHGRGVRRTRGGRVRSVKQLVLYCEMSLTLCAVTSAVVISVLCRSAILVWVIAHRFPSACCRAMSFSYVVVA